jgi:hypothetical protein
VIFVVDEIDLIEVISIESIVFIREIEISAVRLPKRRMKVSKDEIEREMSMRLEESLGRHHEVFISHPTIANPSQDLKPCVVYILLIRRERRRSQRIEVAISRGQVDVGYDGIESLTYKSRHPSKDKVLSVDGYRPLLNISFSEEFALCEFLGGMGI